MESRQNRVKALNEQTNQLLTGKEFCFKDSKDKESWQKIPRKSGVYLIIEERRCIYVGQSKNLRERLTEHGRGNLRRNGRGNLNGDTFNKKLYRIRQIEEKEDRIKFVKDRCFFKFLEIKKGKHLYNLEHFTIAVLDPELND